MHAALLGTTRGGGDGRLAAMSTAPAAAARTLMRAIIATVAALVVTHLTIPGRPSTLCPFRALTGIPCPVCGSTTAAVHLGHLDIAGAMRANPFTLLAAAAFIVAPALATVPWLRNHGKSVASHIRRRGAALCVAIVLLSEIWQLIRFNVI
jgi:hypothetical protein